VTALPFALSRPYLIQFKDAEQTFQNFCALLTHTRPLWFLAELAEAHTFSRGKSCGGFLCRFFRGGVGWPDFPYAFYKHAIVHLHGSYAMNKHMDFF
jgi:hypothetical protein